MFGICLHPETSYNGAMCGVWINCKNIMIIMFPNFFLLTFALFQPASFPTKEGGIPHWLLLFSDWKVKIYLCSTLSTYAHRLCYASSHFRTSSVPLCLYYPKAHIFSFSSVSTSQKRQRHIMPLKQVQRSKQKILCAKEAAKRRKKKYNNMLL